MKLKLNFKLDEPNTNNRVYPKDVIIKSLDFFINNGLSPMLFNPAPTTTVPNFGDICAILNDYEVTQDNIVIFDFQFIDTPIGKQAKPYVNTILNSGQGVYLSLSGVGGTIETELDGKAVDIINDGFHITYLFFILEKSY